MLINLRLIIKWQETCFGGIMYIMCFLQLLVGAIAKAFQDVGEREMVRTPCCDQNGMKKGTWTPKEDRKLVAYVTRYGC